MLLGDPPLFILTIAKDNALCPDGSQPNILIQLEFLRG